ncbi:hypothetical protein EBR21_01970 [bacterium]|nr:hypothetical protein [bacterium]
MSAALLPLAMFLINESTRDIYVLPPEAAEKLPGVKPCAAINSNISATVFSPATLDQMCTSLAQGLLPKVNSVTKTNWSVDSAKVIGSAILALQSAPGLRTEAPVWPPEIPFSMAGLTSTNGMNLVVGIKIADKVPALVERVDVWSNIEGRFTRVYWSRSMNDPTYTSSQTRIIQRVGSYISRAWKSQSLLADKPETLKLLVDKKISEKEMAIVESVLKAYSKGASEVSVSPTEVRKDGIIFRTSTNKSKQAEVVARLARELPALKTQAVNDGSIDVSVMLSAPN